MPMFQGMNKEVYWVSFCDKTVFFNLAPWIVKKFKSPIKKIKPKKSILSVNFVFGGKDYECDTDTETNDEEYELRSNVIIGVIQKSNVTALYSSPNSLELFFLSKVISFDVAPEWMVDKYNHIIEKCSNYLKCQYFQKEKESKGKVQYKVLPDEIFSLAIQIMNPLVKLNDDCTLSSEECQWLTDSM